MSILFSEIERLSTFQITTSAKDNTAILYANGLQQVMLFVSIAAYDKEYGAVLDN